MSTEHRSLLALRSLAWKEVFSRASMFLTTLSAVLVALGLSAEASGFGSGLPLFALVLLSVALFVGMATFLRPVWARTTTMRREHWSLLASRSLAWE